MNYNVICKNLTFNLLALHCILILLYSALILPLKRGLLGILKIGKLMNDSPKIIDFFQIVII